jgi:hypothetical protein
VRPEHLQTNLETSAIRLPADLLHRIEQAGTAINIAG